MIDKSNLVEVISVYADNEVNTYLASDYLEHGTDATPIFTKSYATKQPPIQKFYLKDLD